MTWKSHDLPKMVATWRPDRSRALRLASSSTAMLARRVLPKAATGALGELDVLDPLEKLDVLGVGAGPAALDIVEPELRRGDWRTLTLSSAEKEMPSPLGAVAQRRIVKPNLLWLVGRLLNPSLPSPYCRGAPRR